MSSDLTPLLSMPLLEELTLLDGHLKDLSTLIECKILKKLNIGGNKDIEDLSPLSRLPLLDQLVVWNLPLIKDLSFFEKGFAKLRALDLSYLELDDLSPLTRLQNLEELSCPHIPITTSLLPLARCIKLKNLRCPREGMDLDQLKERRPDLQRHD
jgi:Leucine-rich repeat (LRR) protein